MDLSASDIREKVQHTKKYLEANAARHNVFVLYVSCHGSESAIYGSDNKAVPRQEIVDCLAASKGEPAKQVHQRRKRRDE
jgi:hypothetical protein